MPATTSAKINGKVVQATVVMENVEDEDEFPVSLVFEAQAGQQEVGDWKPKSVGQELGFLLCFMPYQEPRTSCLFLK